jgi:hypothetical protein
LHANVFIEHESQRHRLLGRCVRSPSLRTSSIRSPPGQK